MCKLGDGPRTSAGALLPPPQFACFVPLENERYSGSGVKKTSARAKNGKEWEALYAKLQAIERTFKSLKQSRRLERHYIRGLRQVRLHCLMAVLAYQATVLAHVQADAIADMRWQVRRVA